MKYKIIHLTMLLLLGIHFSCDTDNSPTFTAETPEEGIVFENEFAAEYLLSDATAANIAERFIWKETDFGAAVNKTYELQASVSADFETFDVIGATSETNLGITVDQLMDYARDLGLDSDPGTTDENGEPNNTGVIYLRLRAYAGTGNANAVEILSEIHPMNIRLVEETGSTGCPPVYVLGPGAVDAGWDWENAIVFNCDQGTYTARLRLTNEVFRFFDAEGDWESGMNYEHFSEEGYDIDPLLENAGDNDDNFMFTGTPGIYEIVVDGTSRSVTVTASAPYYAVGDAVPGNWGFEGAVSLEETEPYVRKATMEFVSGIFRFFTVKDDWGSGLTYAYFDDQKYTVDPALESAGDDDGNFSFAGTPGTYTLTINEKEKIITLE